MNNDLCSSHRSISLPDKSGTCNLPYRPSPSVVSKLKQENEKDPIPEKTRVQGEKMQLMKIFMLSAILALFLNCSNGLFGDGSPDIEKKDGKTFLIDNTDKRWDITHAIEKYKMEAKRFQFGLGPFAIRPIQAPTFLNPGSSGYPDQNADFLVLGFSLDKDTRAYPIEVMTRHEIADDKFGDTHVAVAY